MYSLIEEQWILAVDTTGEPLKVSLREVFDGSHKIERVRGDSPLQDYAITRLLLAIFWRAHSEKIESSPGSTFNFEDWFERTWEKISGQGSDPLSVMYLEKYAERFDLLDPNIPFMQVADLQLKDGSARPVIGLVPEIQDDFFTMRAGEQKQDLSLDEAARWLVYTQAYDYSGIKSGAVGDPRVKGGRGYPIGQGWTGLTGGVLVRGETLLHTLMLNTVQEALLTPADLPVWERQPDGPAERKNPFPQGAADIATWQSRRLRLFAEEQRVVEILVCNGDKIPDAGANVMVDPMTPYRWSRNKSKRSLDVYFPRPFDQTRTMWRSLDALIVGETDGGFGAKDKRPKRPRTLDSLASLSQRLDDDVIPEVLDVVLYSIQYGPQASSVATTFHSGLSVPVRLLIEENADLRERVRIAASQASEAGKALGIFQGNLFLAAGGEYEFRAELTDKFLADLEPKFIEWLRTLSLPSQDTLEAMDQQLEQWQFVVRKDAESIARAQLRGAGPRALAGRIIPGNDKNSRGRLVSAGSVYGQLTQALNKSLPATVNKADAQKPTTETQKEEIDD